MAPEGGATEQPFLADLEQLASEVRSGFQKQEVLLVELLQHIAPRAGTMRVATQAEDAHLAAAPSSLAQMLPGSAGGAPLQGGTDVEDQGDGNGCMQASTSTDAQDDNDDDYGFSRQTSDDTNLTVSTPRSRRMSTVDKALRDQANHKASVARSTQMLKSSTSLHETISLSGRIRSAQQSLKAFLERQEVGLVIVTMICSNVVMVGVEVDFSGRLPTNEAPPLFHVLNLVYTVLFTVEIVLKMAGYGLVGFFFGPDKLWNWFDGVVVASAIFETVLVDAVSVGHLRVFRVLRVARIFRSIRVVRILKFVASLRNLLLSISHTLKTLFWTMVLVGLNLYGFGVALAQATYDHCRAEAIRREGDINAVPVCLDPHLVEFWGDLPTSMFTLLKTITGGLSWHEAVSPLADVGPLWVITFTVYLVFMYFAVLNVVTGVFCQTAIESAAADKEMATMLQLHNRQVYIESLRKLFSELDHDGSNEITIDELESKLKDDSLSAFFESMNVDTDDAWLLFSLIDKDMSGCIDAEEFITGCLQLKGPAKAIHMAKINVDNKSLRMSIDRLEEAIATIKDELVDVRYVSKKSSSLFHGELFADKPQRQLMS
eukprot:TRINITY_DN47721_c0_g1_i1.p1 TRINITY_DN47721_c0_g1~~TRINITY_DN47721_c0_g1_i1.p1  ORF type:complete len:601 (+),score=105.69 TRINITY_DN47721_c0_g1_i1:77-1879(+)